MSSCSIPACDNSHYARGWCNKHYARWRRHGDPLKVLQLKSPSAVCSVEGCSQPSKTRTLCTSHYSRYRKSGEWPTTPLTPHWKHEGTCSRCDLPARTKGMCHKHYRRHRLLVTEYGCNWELFDALWEEAEGKCQICGSVFKDKDDSSACVDHHHGTGQIRGILCRTCNAGLGHFKDSEQTLRNAITYLQEETQ